MNYYYFAASLPGLSLDVPPPFSFGAFRAMCVEHLGPSDRRGLDELDAGPDEEPRHPFARAWHDRERSLRNAVARIRCARLRKDPEAFVRPQEGYDGSAEQAVSEAFAKPDPLQRELALDRFRWKQLDALAGFNPFTGGALLAYAVKVRLAERWSGMDEKTGNSRAEAITAGTARASTAP